MKRIIVLFTALLIFTLAAQAQTQQAPNFTLKTFDGKSVTLSKLKGKVVLVNFWATWCPPCRAEIPDFIEAYKTYKSKGLEIVGIALDQDGWEQVQPFIKEHGMNYPVVLGTQEVVEQYGGIEAIPTTFIIDKKGTVVDRTIGMLRQSVLEAKLKPLLK